MKQADGVAASAHAGDQEIGQPFFPLEDLAARFLADDPVKIPHHHGIGMRPEGRA